MPVMGHGSIKGQVMYRPPKEASVSRDGYLYARDEGGGVVYHSHADAYKQVIHTGFLLDSAEPGSMCLFRPTRHNEHAGYARHIASEQQIEAGTGAYKWERTRGGGENHWLDATCLAQAAITYLEHRMPALAINLARPTSDAPAPREAPAPARPAPTPPTSSPPTRPRGFERPEARNPRWRGIRSRR